MSADTIHLPYGPPDAEGRSGPHQGQQQFHRLCESTMADIALRAGRSWGKTLAGTAQAYSWMLRGQRVIWGAGNRNQLTSALEYLRLLVGGTPPEYRVVLHKSERVIRCGEGALYWVSLWEPDNIRGAQNIHHIVVDEAREVTQYAVQSVLRPMLASGGRFYYLSTPGQEGWLQAIWDRGDDTADPDIVSLYAPVAEWRDGDWRSAVSHLTDADIQRAYRESTERTFRQEYLAEPQQWEGAYLRGVGQCIDPAACLRGPQGGRYSLGVDVARKEGGDYSAFVVLDGGQTPSPVAHVHRYRGVEFALQQATVERLTADYDCTALVDEAGIGMAFVEQMSAAGCRVQAVNTGRLKRRLIEGLAVALEKRTVLLPDDSTEEGRALLKELETYQRRETATGQPSYSAPSGMHDDLVMALALAVWGRQMSAPAPQAPSLAGVELGWGGK